MPKRTTPLQMMVHFVRKHLAKPDVTVSESKLLRDVRLGTDREVDVVVEGKFDGEPVVTSVEVIEHTRAASVTWVEQQIAKHRHLPTNRLVLVSKSGFSKNALKAVAAEGGWVAAVRPEMVEINGRPVVKRLFIDTIKLTPINYRMRVRRPDGEAAVILGIAHHDVYSATGDLIGPLSHLGVEAVNLDWLKNKFIIDAHAHPERSELKGFSCLLPIGELGYCLRENEAGDLHRIELLAIEGQFAFAQDEIPFTVTDLAGRRYGAGEALFMGRRTVWVATDDEDARITTISWRTADDKPLFDPWPVRPMLFQDLMTLVPPPDF
jgi:hypothetical protein